jgi:hypothetical protein
LKNAVRGVFQSRCGAVHARAALRSPRASAPGLRQGILPRTASTDRVQCLPRLP